MAKTPEQVLSECGVTKQPVPIEKIPQHYGILVCPLRANEDIFGAIVRTAKKVVIAINPAQHPNRQRFTIAHELGHFFCHPEDSEHVDRDFRISWRNTESSRGVNWKEIEANRFAAALLMPEDFIRRDLNRISDINDTTIKQLAASYKVSMLAMKFRLMNLGLLSPDLDLS
jgi:Zn-dependent peptidase ImmA (M78 family)